MCKSISISSIPISRTVAGYLLLLRVCLRYAFQFERIIKGDNNVVCVCVCTQVTVCTFHLQMKMGGYIERVDSTPQEIVAV